MVFILIRWLISAMIVLFTAWLLPGITVENFFAAMGAAFVIALINISIKPVLNLITMPFNILSFGIMALIINALLLMFTAYVVPGFEVSGFLNAFFGSIIISVLSFGVSILKL